MTSLTKRLRRRMDGLAQTTFRSTVKSVLAPAIFLATCANGFASSDAPSGPLNPTEHGISSDALMRQNTIEPTIAGPALDAQQGASNAQAQQEAISEGVSFVLNKTLNFIHPLSKRYKPTSAESVGETLKLKMEPIYSNLDASQDERQKILDDMMAQLSDFDTTRETLQKISDKLFDAEDEDREYHGEEYSSVPRLATILSKANKDANSNIQRLLDVLPIWQYKLAKECFKFAKKYDLECGALPISIAINSDIFNSDIFNSDEEESAIRATKLARCFLDFYDAYREKSYDGSDPIKDVAKTAVEIGNKSAKIFMNKLILECKERDSDAPSPFYDRLNTITEEIQNLSNVKNKSVDKFMKICEEKQQGRRRENALNNTLRFSCYEDQNGTVKVREDVDAAFSAIIRDIREENKDKGALGVLNGMRAVLNDFAVSSKTLYNISMELPQYVIVSLKHIPMPRLQSILTKDYDTAEKDIRTLLNALPVLQYKLACECFKFAKEYNLPCDASPISILLSNRIEPITQDQAQELAGCFLDFYDASAMGSELMTDLTAAVETLHYPYIENFMEALLQKCKNRDENNISAINDRFLNLKSAIQITPNREKVDPLSVEYLQSMCKDIENGNW